MYERCIELRCPSRIQISPKTHRRYDIDDGTSQSFEETESGPCLDMLVDVLAHCVDLKDVSSDIYFKIVQDIRQLGWCELYLVLANLLRRYDLKLENVGYVVAF